MLSLEKREVRHVARELTSTLSYSTNTCILSMAHIIRVSTRAALQATLKADEFANADDFDAKSVNVLGL